MRVLSRRLGVGAVFLFALLVPAGASAADLWGIDLTGSVTREQLSRVKAGGAGEVRAPLDWAAVIASRGARPDWSSFDPLVESAAAAGIPVLPVLGTPPEWAVPYESLGDGDAAPRNLPVRTSRQRSGWARFLRLAAERYGPSGSFWSERPDLPRRPIRTWQVWNEPNFEYYAARPSPAEYGRLVAISHRALTSTDRGARLLLAGLFGRPSGSSSTSVPKRAYFASDFLDRMYDSTPGISGAFDAVALHPYSYSYRQLAPQIEEVRAVLRQHGDSEMPLWITELGWSSGRPDASNGHNGFEKGPAGQARELTRAFELLRRHRTAWRLQGTFWFSLTDAPGACNFCDGSGLFNQQFRPKPAWRAFQAQAALRTDRP